MARETKPAIHKPASVRLDRLDRVTLRQEETEALRLADLEGLTQAEAGLWMGVSRSASQWIVAHAHHQVALALVKGHALEIDGGAFEVAPPRPRGPRRRDHA